MIYEVYTASYCPFCVEAVGILVKQGCDFRVYDVTNDKDVRKQLTAVSGCVTLPQIYRGSQFIGGCSDLKTYFLEEDRQ